MTVDQCFELGVVTKPHGLHGELSAKLDVDYPEAYEELESVFVEQNQKLVPFFIETLQLQGDRALLKLEEVDSIEAAEALKGARLFLPLKFLPKLEGNQFYFHELMGCELVDATEGVIGPIEQIYSAGPQELASVKYQGQEVLVPLQNELIIRFDREQRQLHMTLPEGLLDLYR